jgi:hypothetical protein
MATTISTLQAELAAAVDQVKLLTAARTSAEFEFDRIAGSRAPDRDVKAAEEAAKAAAFVARRAEARAATLRADFEAAVRDQLQTLYDTATAEYAGALNRYDRAIREALPQAAGLIAKILHFGWELQAGRKSLSALSKDVSTATPTHPPPMDDQRLHAAAQNLFAILGERKVLPVAGGDIGYSAIDGAQVNALKRVLTELHRDHCFCS